MAFRFKQFVVEDDQSSMRIGTDAVLLGSWINPGYASYILEIGTGCGVIALMMAQKCNAEITAIDIDEKSVRQADMNFRNASWHIRLKTLYCSFQEFADYYPDKFDLIITNPPYFINSLSSPFKSRNIARHDDQLNTRDLIKGVTRILGIIGKFCLIFPAEGAIKFQDYAKEHSLFLNRQLMVKPKPGAKPNRIAMEFSFTSPESVITEEIIIRREDNSFTDDYRELTKDFYLEF